MAPGLHVTDFITRTRWLLRRLSPWSGKLCKIRRRTLPEDWSTWQSPAGRIFCLFLSTALESPAGDATSRASRI
jgi:hypothetical protein